MFERYEVKDFEKYLKSLNKFYTDSIMWHMLQKKSEYGTARSEKGYQMSASISVRKTARNLGLSDDRAELFVKFLGSYFPKYGAEGKKCIREFLCEKGISISEPEFAAEFIEDDLDRGGSMLAVGLKELLVELFDFEKNSGDNEFELAKLYHIITEILKLTYAIEGAEKYKVLDRYFDENALNNIQRYGIFNYRKELEAKLAVLSERSAKMSDEEKEKYKDKISSYMRSFKNDGDDGIYIFVSIET